MVIVDNATTNRALLIDPGVPRFVTLSRTITVPTTPP